MRKVLAVIDIQKDFVSGSLGSREAAEMMPLYAGLQKALMARWCTLLIPTMRITWTRRRAKTSLLCTASKARKAG